MIELLDYGFMRNALVASLLIGACAPLVGIFLVQRRLSLIGDGIGHVALAGVAVGLLTGTSPVWTALLTAAARGRPGGDVALALMFYGGIAAGVVLIGRSPQGTSANLTSYLFGSITATTADDLIAFTVLTVLVVAVTVALRPWLFAVAQDEEYARASGLPVLGLNVALSVLTAVTVVVSMRVVGLLLVSALMIIPNAAAQQVSRSFAGAMQLAVLLGVVASVGGVATSFYAETPSGGTIVLLALALYLVAQVGARWRPASRHGTRAERHTHEHGPGCGHEAIPHGDHVDYLHDGHRHAPHDDHYDEHAEDHRHEPEHEHERGRVR
ncbi:metal ABC transporter permease [Nostocoides jenkinsii]|nr:metal ABC transporter permease [Tetrasphaera jenkinsii]